MRKLFLVLLLFFVNTTIKAQIEDDFEDEIFVNQSDYLVPTESLLNSYPYRIRYVNKIKEILFNGLPQYFDIQYFATPSFETERVLIIRKNKIYYHQAKQSIWYHYFEEINGKENNSSKSKEVVVKKYKNDINTSDAKLIKRLYRAALSKARFRIFTESELNNLIISNDGTTYSFSLSDYGISEGQTWSPKKDSRMYRLVEINDDLISIVKNTNENDIITLPSNLKKRIKKLIDEINLSDYNFERHTLHKVKDTIIKHLNQNVDFDKLEKIKYLSVGDDFIYTIKKGKIKRIKLQEVYYDQDYGKFVNWFNNVFDKDASKEYKKALKNLDLSYLNLELNLKVYIDLMYDKETRLLKER